MSSTIQFNAEADRTPVHGTQLLPRPDAEHWYATYTSPRHEKLVAQQMQARRIDCFLPLYKSVRRWKDRRKHLDLPLFPGYVFVRIAVQDRLRVLGLPGVIQIVSFNGK